MAKTKKATVVDTTAGAQAYALALAHRPLLDPRLPTGTIDNLGIDLTTLGASPSASATPPPATPASPAPAAPTLAEALSTASNLVTAIHEAVSSARAKPDVRKAYGAGSKAVGKEVKTVLAAADKIVARATTAPAEALSLGILPSDVTALEQGVTSLQAAEATATTHGTSTSPTAKQKHAAEVRMHEATARIAGVGALAFALNATVRAQFAALAPKKKKG